MKSWSAVSIPQLPGSGQLLHLWNEMSGRVEPTKPNDGRATMYVCGITPYDSTHMGHAATYVTFDLVNRVWRDAGYSVGYVQNVTDIDDPLLERALKVGKDWKEIAAQEIQRFQDDMVALRVLPPDDYVLVTEHMNGIIAWITRMIDVGSAYSVDRDVYFDSQSANVEHHVAHLSVEQQLEIFAQRGGDPIRPGKRNQLDALLWRGKRPGEPSWDAPFGAGRPGWHIECLAIAQDFLGRPVTVQGGGSDLVFPHHEMCHLQSAALDQTDFASLFAYAGMVCYQGEKMSKSLGNLVFVSDLVAAGIDPMAIRLSILSSHYRQSWEWSNARLDQAQTRLASWNAALAMQAGASAMGVLDDVRQALANDLDVPAALAFIDAWAHDTIAGNGEDPQAQGVVARMLDSLLGIAL